MHKIRIPPSKNNPVDGRRLEEAPERFRQTRIIIGEIGRDKVLEVWNTRYPVASSARLIFIEDAPHTGQAITLKPNNTGPRLPVMLKELLKLLLLLSTFILLVVLLKNDSAVSILTGPPGKYISIAGIMLFGIVYIFDVDLSGGFKALLKKVKQSAFRWIRKFWK
jgi:hypothetical protein